MPEERHEYSEMFPGDGWTDWKPVPAGAKRIPLSEGSSAIRMRVAPGTGAPRSPDPGEVDVVGTAIADTYGSWADKGRAAITTLDAYRAGRKDDV